MAGPPPPSQGHDWQPISPGSLYYTCVRCHISGKKTANSWPPIRDPKFAAPVYATCKGTEAMKDDDFWKEMKEKYGVEKP